MWAGMWLGKGQRTLLPRFYWSIIYFTYYMSRLLDIESTHKAETHTHGEGRVGERHTGEEEEQTKMLIMMMMIID